MQRFQLISQLEFATTVGAVMEIKKVVNCFIFKVKMQRSQLISLLLVFCFTMQASSKQYLIETLDEVFIIVAKI